MSLLRNARRVFRKLTPAELAASELAEAELARLEAQSAQDFATSMVQYHGKRIDRLRAFLVTQATAEAKGTTP